MNRWRAGDLEFWVERRGQGPDVLLIAGLGDTAEAWQPQLDGLADGYRLTDLTTAGLRTPLPEGALSVSIMADDAAALRWALEIPIAHVAGFSWEAPSPRSWCFDTPGSFAASFRSARTHVRTPSCVPSSRSGGGCQRWPRATAFYEAFFTWVLHGALARGRFGGPDGQRFAPICVATHPPNDSLRHASRSGCLRRTLEMAEARNRPTNATATIAYAHPDACTRMRTDEAVAAELPRHPVFS